MCILNFKICEFKYVHYKFGKTEIMQSFKKKQGWNWNNREFLIMKGRDHDKLCIIPPKIDHLCTFCKAFVCTTLWGNLLGTLQCGEDTFCTQCIEWPQRWSFADLSNFSKINSKMEIIFWFDFHGCSHWQSKIGNHFRKQSGSKIEVFIKWR